MKATIFKCHQNTIRLCLFKVALLLSVFAFSGFNEKIEAAFQESTITELVESSIDTSVFDYKKITKRVFKVALKSFFAIPKPYGSSALLNCKKSINLKYKTASAKTLAYNFSSLHLPIKRSPSTSKDEFPAFLLG